MRPHARRIALGSGVAVVLCIPLVVSVTAEAADAVVLSQGRPVVASSSGGAGLGPANAVDGDTATRWASAAAGTQWLRVDLGSGQEVQRVRLVWDRTYAVAYRIQTSPDGASWTDVVFVATGDGGTDDMKSLQGTGRYVRMLATEPAAGAGYALRELQVYGKGPASPPPAPGARTVPSVASGAGLTDPKRKEIALQLVSSAENSTLNWRGEYGYIEDIGDGRGYTAGIVGFCSGTSDMLALVTEYTRRKSGNRLARYLPALRAVDGSDSHAGLDPGFVPAWKAAAKDPVFQKAQQDERDRVYFTPAVQLAQGDGVRALGQFAYYDAAVMHGMSGLRGIRSRALLRAKPPRQGGDELGWLTAFLDARVAEMRKEEAHSDTSRVDTAQREFLDASNLDLNLPLVWHVYGDRFAIG